MPLSDKPPKPTVWMEAAEIKAAEKFHAKLLAARSRRTYACRLVDYHATLWCAALLTDSNPGEPRACDYLEFLFEHGPPDEDAPQEDEDLDLLPAGLSVPRPLPAWVVALLYFRGADVSRTSRGDAAAGTRIFRGDRVVAHPRLGRGHFRGDRVAAPPRLGRRG